MARKSTEQRAVDRNKVIQSILEKHKPGRLLDLGAGHGMHSQQMRDMGWNVTAVDARGERFPKESREPASETGIEWVVSDVRDYARTLRAEDFDCILIFGLLYHLDLDSALDLLRSCSGTFTLLDTSTSLDAETEEQGYQGSYRTEAPKAKTEEEHRKALRSSWGNRYSFWPTQQSLLLMLRRSGYSFVAPVRPYWIRDTSRRTARTFYMCYP